MPLAIGRHGSGPCSCVSQRCPSAWAPRGGCGGLGLGEAVRASLQPRPPWHLCSICGRPSSRLSSFLPCSCPPPSPAPPSLRHCPHPSPWPLHSLRGHRWAVCSPVWACLSRSPKTAYSAEAGSSLAHSGLRPLGYSRGLKASIHSFLYLVPEAPPEHLPLRRPGWAVTQSSLQESGRNRDSGHWEMRGGPGSSPCAVQSVTRREGLKSRKQFYGHACNLCIQVPSPAIPEAG